MHLSKIILILLPNGQGAVGKFNSCSSTENSLNSTISCHKVKFFFSLKILLSPIVMKYFKNFCFVEHWILNCHAWLKTKKKKLPGHPLLANGNSINLSFYLNHYYTHISKQILEYIFPLNKYMESWDAVLTTNQLTSAILQEWSK